MVFLFVLIRVQSDWGCILNTSPLGSSRLMLSSTRMVCPSHSWTHRTKPVLAHVRPRFSTKVILVFPPVLTLDTMLLLGVSLSHLTSIPLSYFCWTNERVVLTRGQLNFLSFGMKVFFGRNDAKAETPVVWPPHAKSWLIGKDSDTGRDWGQEEKGTTEDEMAGWHHWLDGCEFEWTPGVGDGQGGLACCDSWGQKESDTPERLNWTELNWWRTCIF